MFLPGTRVKLLYTAELGTVVDQMDGGMVRILLDDSGMHKPAFPDELVRLMPSEETPLPKLVPLHTETDQTKVEQKPIRTEDEMIPTDKGLFLGFEAVHFQDGIPKEYDVWIINDTPQKLVFEYRFHIRQSLFHQEDGVLMPYQTTKLKPMAYDDLNELPSCYLAIEQHETDGNLKRFQQEFKLKPRTFFKKLAQAPLRLTEMNLYEVVLKHQEKKPIQDDLKSYTKNNLRPQQTQPNRYYQTIDLEAAAAFKNEIDLHIQALIKNPDSIDSRQILSTQLFHFEQFMAEALRLGVDKVFVIHGLGEGKLKKEIEKRLRTMKSVKKFINEYHPRYGFGATEVWFT